MKEKMKNKTETLLSIQVEVVHTLKQSQRQENINNKKHRGTFIRWSCFFLSIEMAKMLTVDSF